MIIHIPVYSTQHPLNLSYKAQFYEKYSQAGQGLKCYPIIQLGKLMLPYCGLEIDGNESKVVLWAMEIIIFSVYNSILNTHSES